MYDFKADVAILLNITPDHLDRYDIIPKLYRFQIQDCSKHEERRLLQSIGTTIRFSSRVGKEDIQATKCPFAIEKKEAWLHMLKNELLKNNCKKYNVCYGN
jgi:UDP-N-acetylmuramoylalanine--D-glutamate ligase